MQDILFNLGKVRAAIFSVVFSQWMLTDSTTQTIQNIKHQNLETTFLHKMSKNDFPTEPKPREIYNLIEGDGAFHLVDFHQKWWLNKQTTISVISN